MWKRGVERWRKISRNGGKNEWINAEREFVGDMNGAWRGIA